MFLATTNKSKRLLHLSYIGNVGAAELRRGLGELGPLLAELPPGFRVLVDWERLERMELDCAKEIGAGMEMLEKSGMGSVVRVIPDASKDIGINILAAFHYQNQPQVATCENMAEAAKLLEL